MSDHALIILAAGESSRMGRAKQLIEFEGTTLLDRIVNAGIKSRCSTVIVVLGSQFDLMKEAAQTSFVSGDCTGSKVLNPDSSALPDSINYHPSKRIEIVRNHNWKEGMASSIVAGIKFIHETRKDVKSAVIATCDQPFVSEETIDSLIDLFESSNCSIVASKYENTKGVPALFKSSLFEELETLSGTEGARKLIRRYENEVLSIDFPEGAIDLDSKEDWQKLLKTQSLQA